MEKFRKQEIKIDHRRNSDTGIKVSKLIELIDNNDFTIEIKELLEIDNIINDFIQIEGASTLVNTIKGVNNQFKKIDLESEFEDISLYTQDEFTINFHNLNGNPDLTRFNNKTGLATIPIYSSRRDFFSNILEMDKYASRLIDAGHKEILQENIRMLKGKYKKLRKYRILHDIDEDVFYLRGIISTKYNNYDNNLAIVIGLLTLHHEMKTTNKVYRLKLCEYNESSIRMFFESSEINEVENIGYVKNIIEISNDEIKREALKFSGICTIEFQDSEKNSKELFIKPKEVKSKILSIRHNQSPISAIPELVQIENAEKIHKELFEDIVKIKNIKNPEQIKFLFRSKVENARRDELKIYKEDILKALYKTVDNIIDLLELFDKINLIADRDIEVKEYLRYIIYEVLIRK